MWTWLKSLFVSTADVNKDGKVNAADVKAVADVNKDGKVNVADAKIVADKIAVAAAPVVEKAAVVVATNANKVATKARTKGKAKGGTKK